MTTKDIRSLKRIAPKLAHLKASSTDAELLFAAMLDRARARETTNLKQWHWNLTTQGVSVFPENVQLFERLSKRGCGEFTGYARNGHPLFKFKMEYDTFLDQLEKLAKTGAGSFIAGSGEIPPRFKWGYNIRHLAIVAQKPKEVDNVVNLASRRKPVGITPVVVPPVVQVNKGAIVALFTQLNGDTIRLEIPPTFTLQERDRLTDFIKTINAR